MGKLNLLITSYRKCVRRSLLVSFLNFILLLLSKIALAQGSSAPMSFVVTPKSPNVAAMEKYGNFEVNLFHGVPEISIPILEVKSKGFSIPITLSYHASGIKVSDVASWTGLGWSLNAGGQVSRNVKGKDDLLGILKPDYIMKTPAQVNPNSFDGYLYLKSLSTNDQDGEPDVFSYNMAGKHGNFLYKNPTTPVLIPSEPIRILRDQITQGTSSNFRFNLLDEQGTNYLFGKSLTGESIMEFSSFEIGGAPNSYASSWLLTDMISSDKSDTVSYSYYPQSNVQLSAETIESVSVTDNISYTPAPVGNGSTIPPQPPIPASIVNRTTSSNFSVGQRLIKEIQFENGKVEFVASTNNRADVGTPALDRILIYSKNKGILELLKTVRFYYSYFGSSSESRLKLDSITVNPSDSQPNQTYRFTYNPQPSLPYYKKARDYWGYFNNYSNSTLVPLTVIPYQIGNYPAGTSTPNTAQIGTANRAPNPDAVQSNILKRIQYPTGGYTIFNYEPNKFSGVVNNMIGGGVRIQSILTYASANSEPVIKSYKYGTDLSKESGSGILNSAKTLYFTPKQISSYDLSASALTLSDNRTYSSEISYSMNEYDDSNVFYPFVTEYTGTPEVNVGKKEHVFSMEYDRVVINSTYGFMPQVESFHWKRGKLLQLKEYEKLTGPSYKLKKETNNYYSSVKPETISNIGINVVQTYSISGVPESSYYSGGLPRPYSYSFYDLLTGAFLPSLSTVKTYGTTNNLETSTEYKYNNAFQPSIIKNLKSNGDTIITRYKYADDYSAAVSSASGSGIRNMQNSNILTLPIEKTVSIKPPSGSEKVIDGEIKTYYDNKPLLRDFYSLETAQPISSYQASSIDGSGLLSIPSVFKKRINYTTYDVSGNPTEYLIDDKRKNSYIWGYKKNLLIAEVQNAGAGQIAFTSFEEEDKGNWAYNEAAVTSPSSGAVTGKAVFNFTVSGSISKSGLTQEQYEVSYWGKKPCLVNGTVPETTSIANAGGWILYVHLVTPNSGIITLTSSDAVIDELRLYPTAAMMKTYTHLPLVGLSAVGQSDGNFNVYTYDGFQRLANVKDQNLAIIKNYKYNIPNTTQLISVPAVYTNRSVSGTFQRTGCDASRYGTTVKYEIAEGAFYSNVSQQDAQAKADAALIANGQQYANNNGECRLKTEVTWEPIEAYCQIKRLIVPNPPTISRFTLNVQSAPNTTNFANVTITRPDAQYSVLLNYVIYFQGGKQLPSSVILEAGETTKTFSISVYPYTNDMRSGWDLVSVDLSKYMYVAGTSFYARRQKKVGGQVVLTEPNLKGIGEGPYYDVVRSTIPGYSACQTNYMEVIPVEAAYANTDLSVEFTKVCPSGQRSTIQEYTVPAGRYTSSVSQADADEKAMADANTNGQAYVNANGTCF
jgi:hypothetical protein